MIDNSLEIGVDYSPLSTSEMKRESAVVLGAELVPETIVTDIRLNEEAKKLLHPTLKYLCSPDYMKGVCLMTTPLTPLDESGSEEQRRILTPASWGRAMPVGYGFMPYADRFVGGTVMGKGCNVTGRNYGADGRPSYRDPIGFFGKKDAEHEIITGTQLLARGFRVGLPIGYAIFDDKKLREWLVDKWSRNPDLASNVEENLAKVTQHGDNPVFFLRITGVTERLWKFLPADKRSIHRYKAEMARASRLLKLESQIFPNHFRCYLDNEFTLEETGETLDKISRRERINQRDFNIFFRVARGIFEMNAHAVGEVAREKLLGDQFDYNYFAEVLAQGKDIDLALFTQDFEEAQIHSPSESETSSPEDKYLSHTKNLLRQLLTKEYMTKLFN